MSDVSLIPTQLIVGSKEHVSDRAQAILQEYFCKLAQSGNPVQLGCFCSECKKIKQRQHAFAVWISPEKGYTVDDIAIIFDRARFALDDGQKFFFILENAHTLTTATANRLLKMLEEPPIGYIFLLLTSNSQAILPTIASRCLIVQEESETASDAMLGSLHPILSYFCDPYKKQDPFSFEQELKKLHLSDTQSMELLQNLMTIFAQQLSKAVTQGSTDQERLINILQHINKASRKPPQSGSSELFWKNFFMTFPHATTL